MALSEFTLKLVEKKLGDYCQGRVHERCATACGSAMPSRATL